MKNILAAVLLSSTILFTASAHALPVPGLLGKWIAEDRIVQPGVEFQLFFEFTEDRTSMNVLCIYPQGGSLEARVSSLTNYSDNEIYLLEHNTSITDNGIHVCRADLGRAKWTAYFDGTGRMVLFVDVPSNSRLTLVPDSLSN